MDEADRCEYDRLMARAPSPVQEAHRRRTLQELEEGRRVRAEALRVRREKDRRNAIQRERRAAKRRAEREGGPPGIGRRIERKPMLDEDDYEVLRVSRVKG